MRLWIVGNGFDRAHNLPTGYSDYYKYLKATGDEWMASMLGKLFRVQCHGDRSMASEVFQR